MIISPARAEDIRWRTELMKEMIEDLRMGRVITAREIGKMTSWLANRIKTHNYKREDSILERYSLVPLQIAQPRANLSL